MSAYLTPLLKALHAQKASDLHVSSGHEPMLRIGGKLLKLDIPKSSSQEIQKVLSEILNQKQLNELKEKKSLDFSIKIENLGIFRVNAFFQLNGPSIAIRALPCIVPTLEELDLPDILKKISLYPNGLILITGPTGSGKTTTLAAIIDYINKNKNKHIITLEDPIEYQYSSQKSLIHQRQMGTHFVDFKTALKSALREDPDVLLIGEMRDPETMKLAMTAAETGHLVLATLHTNSAPKSIHRIVDSFSSSGEQNQIRSMLSDSLRAIISQKLFVNEQTQKRFALHEVLINNLAIANLIRENKIHQIKTALQTGRKEGMILLDDALLKAVREKKINFKTAWNNAEQKKVFQHLIDGNSALKKAI